MRRYLFDTGIAGKYVDHSGEVRVRAQHAAARGDRIGVAVPVVGELFAGAELSASRAKNRDRLIRALECLTIWPFDRAAAEEYGRLYAITRRMGRPMQQIDIQIAAIALTLGRCTVVSMDSDLSAIPGLAVENWSKD